MRFALAALFGLVGIGVAESAAVARPVDVRTDGRDAHGKYVAVSTGGSARSKGLAVAGAGDAHGGLVAVSVFGSACGDGIANVSVFGGAGGC